MVPRGDLWDNAAVSCMQVHLTVQGMRDQSSLGAVKGNSGLIATGFNSKGYSLTYHRERMITRTLCKPPNVRLVCSAESRPCAGFIYVWTEYLNNAKRSIKRERVF